MTKLGELLKSEREKRELSLHEIGMALKINPKILTAIEDGDSQNLPAKTFLRGFVKSYAQYLRLDLNEVMQLFQQEYGTTRVEEPVKTTGSTTPSAVTTPTPQAPRYETSLKRPDDSALPVASNNRIYTILVAILLLTLIAFVAKMMDKYQKESDTSETAEVEESTVTAIPVSEDASTAVSADPTATTSTTVATIPTTTLAAVSVSTTTIASTTTTAPSTTTTTTTTVKPVVTTTTVRMVAPVTTTTTVSGATTTTTVKAANTEVILEALNKVSIRFTLNNGQKWENLELNPDQVHTFRSRIGVQLEVSDGGAVNVIVNGRDRGVPGTIGKPAKLKYP